MLNETPPLQLPADAPGTTPASAQACMPDPCSPTPADTPAPRWTTQVLMGGGRAAEIAHGGNIYHLRITSLGRLILTK